MASQPSRRWTLALLALAGAAAGWLLVPREPGVEPSAEPPVASRAEPPPDAGPPEAEAIVDAGEVSFTAPFCPPEDADHPVKRPSLHGYRLDHLPLDVYGQAVQAELLTSPGVVVTFPPDGGGDRDLIPCSPGAIRRASALLDEALHRRPDNAALYSLRAELHRCTGELDLADADLLRARELDPTAPALQLEAAQVLRRQGDLAGARAALEAYLRARPDDIGMRRLRLRLEVEAQIESGYASARADGILLEASPAFAAAHRLPEVLEQLRAARDEAARFTGTSERMPLFVVIFPGREELMAVSCVREWAGGLYDGTIKLVEAPHRGVPMVPMRHEVLHAVALADLPSGRPLWFTEGLADHFATRAPLHVRDDQLMLSNHTAIPVPSLVDTLQVLTGPDASLAYAESDALVGLVIHERGEAAIPEALSYLRKGRDPRGLDAALLGHAISTDELLRYLDEQRR